MTTEMSAFLLEGGAETNKSKKTATAVVGKVMGKAGLSKSKSGKRAVVKAPGEDHSKESTTASGQGGPGSPSSFKKTQSGSEYHPPVVPGGDGMQVNKARRASVATRSSELAWVEQMMNSADMKEALKDSDSWDFSVFNLVSVSNNHPILCTVLDAVQRFNLEDSLPINMDNLIRLLLKVEAGYKPISEVPFHNMTHAADVVQGTAYFLSQEVVVRHLSALDIYSMVIGAAIHDYGHPGYNNAFLVASKHETAICYNDVSVLENFHISSSWRLILEEDSNPFAGFTDEQYQEARQTMVYAILGTDMKFHFDHLTKFKTRVSAGAFEDPDRKDVRLLLAMCLHSADVSNPAKKWELTQEWACRVMEEFFQQGDKEAELGLPISPFMDRKGTDIGKCQAGFVQILIRPFFDEWTQFLGESNRHVFQNIESNIKIWSEQGEAAIGDRATALHAGKPPKK